MILKAYCDGSIEGGNPGGWAVGGWVLKDGDSVVSYGCINLGTHDKLTNNIAEYAAVLGVVWWCYDNGADCPIIHSDSMLVVKQLAGDWRCSKKELLFFRDWIWDLGTFSSTKWIPRAENKEADMISRRLYPAVSPEWDNALLPDSHFHCLDMLPEKWLV